MKADDLVDLVVVFQEKAFTLAVGIRRDKAAEYMKNWFDGLEAIRKGENENLQELAALAGDYQMEDGSFLTGWVARTRSLQGIYVWDPGHLCQATDVQKQQIEIQKEMLEVMKRDIKDQGRGEDWRKEEEDE